ncbi:putative lipopolysaccharide biosynthesis O-acetyl transferase WbbJ [uncultured Roseburia sp.]|uniref:Uncharacterized protein n=1 Tax=Brotonthovivens ammoniilytica TaxID=2981725 RepID=A0ABT2TF51_9FIRM|nr:hypothetical protein [Brotonthovivens ammoniilytica]MCU6760818.1 hypothetical protein [Brotonthovivens ammoniilytica]SCI10275.1 putative lipopolysaccharide biosynthesis O-acetyl transferase WbbJ [uncultured Roseburia sp.]
MKYIIIIHKNNREYIVDSYPNLIIETDENTKDNIIHIYDTVKFQEKSLFMLKGIRGNFYFMPNTIFEGVEIRTGPGCFEQNLIVKNNNYFEKNFEIALTTDFSSLLIGANCYFKRNVEIWVGDGHAIINKTNMHALNCNEWNLEISDKVLIEHNVVLLKKAKIGGGSVVKSNSVITKDFSNSSEVMLEGVPAKIVKENIVWMRGKE